MQGIVGWYSSSQHACPNMFIRCDNIADGLSDPSPMLTDIRN